MTSTVAAARPPFEPPDPSDPAALLARLLADFGPSIYRVAFSILRDRSLAEDVVQETVLKAWQHLGEFRGESALRTWVLRIAHNTAVSVRRRRREDPEAPERMPERSVTSDVAKEVEDRLSVASLWEAIHRLDELSRSIVVLREVEHLSYEEIADLLALPLPTVKTRLFRARRQLAQALGGAR